MTDKPNWTGLPDTAAEHRTVGPHRAMCHTCSEWCYPKSLCPCCDQMQVPERWRGLYPAELLAQMTEAVEALPHVDIVDPNGRPRPCPQEWPGGGCRCYRSQVLAIIRGEA